MSKIANIGVIFLATLLPCLSAAAGTGQMFSPAGLPQSSNQNYIVPNPQVSGTTVTFPTPPLPLGGSLQGGPGSTFPAGAAQAGTASESAALKPASPVTEPGNIESFFECVPATRAGDSKTSTSGAAGKSHPCSPVQAVKSPVSSLGKIIWHALDNLGVPMFIGKDSDLDPSLRRTYFMPPSTVSPKSTAPLIPQKIPESELEGTEALPRDDTTPSSK